jgi:hypothetical protein
MNTIELARALKQLRLSGMADVLETRLVQAQAEKLVHLDFLAVLVGDELARLRTGCSASDSRRPSFATSAARSTTSTSTSTRR